MDLSRLNKALSTYEVAEHIYKVDNGKTLGEALNLLEKANAQNDVNINDDDADPLSLKQALKHRAAPTGARSQTDGKMIQLGVNRSKVSFNSQNVRENPTKSYDDAVGRVEKISKSMAEDENCVPWKKRNVSSSQVAMVKKAVLRSREAQKEGFEGHFTVSESTAAMLSAHIARKASLKEGTLTPAQRSISAHPSAAEGSPKIPVRVPSEFDSAAQRAADTKARIPAEFKPKIEATKDRSFGAMAARTKAASTIERPVASKAGLDNPETNSQGAIVDKYWPHPKAAVIKQAKDKTNPKTREGTWPANPADPVYPEETASNRSPGSRW
jgi:hypothetical protein